MISFFISNLKNRAILVFCLLSSLNVSAQDESGTRGNVLLSAGKAAVTGNTYGLITGISKYQANDSYQNLQYADADAKEFYRYITSPTGAKVNPANVDTLFNENASFMEFWRKFNRIKEKLKKNDLFYIYFSGHGDAYRADEAYLLAYDAPAGNDRNNYSTGIGLIDIHKLKVRIQEMTSAGIKVILITDACRTNELPGKDEGQAISYQQIFERKAGEVQLISCASNQVSFEGSQWGGGRGLFSWHLINGLRGMADTDPEDGEVTLTELYDYVKRNVNKASYDAKTKTYRQTPQYCCSNEDGFVLTKVDATEKQKLIARLQSGVSYAPEKADFAVNKSVHLGSAMKEAGLEDLYRLFLKAINEGRLIEKDGAYDLLLQILKQPQVTADLASELKFTLSSKLMTDVTKVLNTYLHVSTNNNNYTYDLFMTAAKKLHRFQELADTNYYNPVDVAVNILFLEGHANWKSLKTAVLQESLDKVNKAIQMKPQAAYLYNLQGLMYLNLHQTEAAKKALRTGISLAPNWLYPYHNLASTLMSQFKYDSAMYYYQKALAIDSNYQTTYGGIGVLYMSRGMVDSSIIWVIEGLKKDPTDPNLWAQLGYGYIEKKNWDQASSAFHKCLIWEPDNWQGIEGLLRVHMYNYKSADSVQYYVKRLIASDSTNPVVYKNLGNIFNEFESYDEALKMFELSIAIDSLNAGTWRDAAASYSGKGMDSAAINILWRAWQLDSTDVNIYNQLGNAYFNLKEYENAALLYKRALEYFPANAVLQLNYATALEWGGKNAEAEAAYKQTIKLDPKYAQAYYRLACIYSAAGKLPAAIAQLELAIKYGEYSRSYIEADTELAPLKNEKGFQKLLQQLK